MAKEPDQTKWVGIRPTDPSEDIPVTTQKLAPAIGDLQAVKERYAATNSRAAVNCTVSGNVDTPQVTAGEIWVVTNMTGVNETTICDIEIRAVLAARFIRIKSFYSVEPGVQVSWSGMLTLIRPDQIYVVFNLGGAADTITVFSAGYKVGVY